MIAFVSVLSAVPIGTDTGTNYPGRLSLVGALLVFFRGYVLCAALLRGPDQFCCFCARTGSGKQSPPADYLLVLRSWFALAFCVLVLCFGFLISFAICCAQAQAK